MEACSGGLSPVDPPVHESLAPWTSAGALQADRNPAKVYIARLAPGSRRSMRTSLELVASILSGGAATADTFPWWSIGYQHVQALRTALAERFAPASANRHLAALRGALQESWRLGLMTAEEYRRAADVKSLCMTGQPHGRALSKAEVRSLFEACAADTGPAGRRDAAIIATLYAGGLRRSELVALDVADYTLATGALIVRHGKGDKFRTTYMTRGSAEALAAWLGIRGPEPGALFWPVASSRRMDARRMTDQSVMYTLRKRAGEAHVPHFSPHDLRRTFISDLLDAGADLVAVQGLAGHSNIQTIARYDRRGERSKQRAAGLLDVPYSG